MPRSRKEKFFIYSAPKHGRWKDQRLLGVNSRYEGNIETITLADLLKFLQAKKIDPSQVVLPNGFSTIAKNT